MTDQDRELAEFLGLTCSECGSTDICCGSEHEGYLCTAHCHHEIGGIYDGKWSGGGTFERGE